MAALAHIAMVPTKAALKIARLGLPVKDMIGRVECWKDDGFELVRE